MTHYTQLWLFFVLVFGIMALPGLNMAFVFGNTLAGGRLRGMAALAGIITGDTCLVIMTVLGISVLIKLIPGAFDVLLIAGAAYLAWIGWSLMRSEAGFGPPSGTPAGNYTDTFRQGMLTSLLNPKAYLFLLAVFPQFLRPAYGPIWMQAVLMWAIIALTAVCVYGSVALMADGARHWLQDKPAANVMAMRCVGGLLIAAALLTCAESLLRRWWA